MNLWIKYLLAGVIFWVGARGLNSVVRNVLSRYLAKEEEKETGGKSPNPGAAIGVFERFLVITLIIFGEYSAIGWIVAAKALARHERLSEKITAEYFLVGTLVSFSIALLTGLLIRALLEIS